MGMMLPRSDMDQLTALGIDVQKLSKTLFQTPRGPNLTHEEKKKLATMNLKEIPGEFNQRVKLEADKPDSVRSIATIFAEHNEKAVPGVMEKALAVGMDGYQLQLWARDLAVKGEDASLIGSMFTEANRTLYPEYVRRVVAQAPMIGLGYATINDLIAAREVISGEIGRGLRITSATGPKSYKVAEGAGLPKVSISLADTTVTVHKHGCEFDMTREVERRATVNLLSIFLQRKGVELQKDLAIYGANVMLNGATDGGTTGNASAITVKQFISQKRAHGHDGYNTDVILYGETVDLLLLENSEIWNPINSQIMLTGQMPMLAGARNLFITEASTSDLGTDYLLYVDTSSCLVMVVEAGSELAEMDYFVQNQMHAYTYSINFALWSMIAAAARKYQVAA